MSEALIAHLAPFAEAEGLTVWQVAEIVNGCIDKKERSCCSLLSWNPEFGYVPAL